MKLFKNLSLLALFLTLSSCGDDDSQPIETFEPALTIDVNAIVARPAGSDITDLVDFGQGPGIPASEYFVALDVNDRLQLRQPQSLPNDVTLWYSRVDFFEEDPVNLGQFTIPVIEQDVIGVWLNFDFPSTANFIDDPLLPPGSGEIFTEFDLFAINADVNDIDYKYDIRVVVEQNGSFFGYYTIDPKIRVKSLN